MMCLKDNLNCMDTVILQGIWDERCNTMTTNKSFFDSTVSAYLLIQCLKHLQERTQYLKICNMTPEENCGGYFQGSIDVIIQFI